MRSFVCAAVAAMTLGGAAFAQQVSTYPGWLGAFQYGDGGEFTLRPDATVANWLGNYDPRNRDWFSPGSFETFCVEIQESIYAGTTYDVTLNDHTVFTGQPLTVGAAFLYEQFAVGQLPYNYNNVPPDDRKTGGANNEGAQQLQNAIWYFMASPGISYDTSNIYENGTVALPANPFNSDNGAHGVAILNLWLPGHDKNRDASIQDQLIYVGQVPEPSSVALLGSAGALMILFRRRR